jgi:hypothetical protein
MNDGFGTFHSCLTVEEVDKARRIEPCSGYNLSKALKKNKQWVSSFALTGRISDFLRVLHTGTSL